MPPSALLTASTYGCRADQPFSLFVQRIVWNVAGAVEDYLHDVAAHLGLERLRRAPGDDLSVVDDGDVSAEAVGLLHDLGGEQDGDALRVEVVEVLPYRDAALRVESDRRLVEEEDFGVVHEGADEVDAAAHAAGVGADALSGHVRKADQLQQLVGLAPGIAPGEAIEHALKLEEVPAGGEVVEAHLLHREADAPADGLGIGVDVVPGHADASRGLPEQRGEYLHRGGLAGAVGAQEAEELLPGDIEVDACDGAGAVRIDLHEVSDLDHVFIGQFEPSLSEQERKSPG